MGEVRRIGPALDLLLGRGAAVLKLFKKVSDKLEADRGVQLSAHDLNLLAEVGLLDLLSSLATEYQVKKCQERNERNRSTSGESSASTAAMGARTSKSSGTTSNVNASEALALAREICRRPN